MVYFSTEVLTKNIQYSVPLSSDYAATSAQNKIEESMLMSSIAKHVEYRFHMT